MNNSYSQSTRVIIDLQTLQTTQSQLRGIDRYSLSFFLNLLAEKSPTIDAYSLISDASLRPYFSNHLEATRILELPILPEWHTNPNYLGGEQDTLDAIAYTSYIQQWKPDIIHVSNPLAFEKRTALPNPHFKSSSQLISATLYDLIPLRFEDHYFQNNDFKRFYLSRINWLRQIDLLFAISEHTRQDAIELLDIDPNRIITIHSAADPCFKPPQNTLETKQLLSTRYPIKERTVLYVAGNEYRKNLTLMIDGFAHIPKEFRENTTLFIICKMPEDQIKFYKNHAFKSGLNSTDIYFTDFISDSDLIAFYGICDAFVFPSKYEGFGLPILEAMASGAPVIGSNNSSIREIIIRQDALFDTDSEKQLADCLVRVLSQPKFANELREYGLKRSKDYSWKNTTQLALQAYNEAIQYKQHAKTQAALSNCLPTHKRLAVLTPLPPCRSGIADYNAAFLPFLAKYFLIDLYVEGYKNSDEAISSCFSIYDVNDFEKVANEYDAILYEMGNSSFHAHMLPLFAKFPGIIVLHDAYLSQLYLYAWSELNQLNYIQEMVDAHGPYARHYLAEQDLTSSYTHLPCTKKLLNEAIGIIAHSPFSLEIANKYYPEGWLAPYHIVPQARKSGKIIDSEQSLKIRNALGFAEDDFLIATFGHIDARKCSDQLLEAFLESSLISQEKVKLIFVGEDFSMLLAKPIQDSKYAHRIRVTNYISEADYEKYLQITDLAFQLRKNSRGETSRGALDCLAYGIPVIVNNDGTYRDYPDDILIKIEPKPTKQQLSQHLAFYYANPNILKKYKMPAFNYIKMHRNARVSAAKYAGIIQDFIERKKLCEPQTWVNAFAPHIAACHQPKIAIDTAASWVDQLITPNLSKRRILVNVSTTAKKDHETGIARVVKEILRELYSATRFGIEPTAVELIDHKLYPATDWLKEKNLSLTGEVSSLTKEPMILQPGDQILMLDSSLIDYQHFFPVFQQAKALSIPIINVIYDLLPIQLSTQYIEKYDKESFKLWFEQVIKHSDELICISKSVADDVTRYIEKYYANSNPTLKISFWHLGSDFAASTHIKTAKSSTQIPNKDAPYLLMVGTIEPRKSHALTLEAFEKLWDEASPLHLYIAGKEGWLAGDLIKKIKSHPLLNKKLFFIDHPTDHNIQILYENATGLLFLSQGEGFGLPLVEAANYGIPIICSNLPVFHEIAGRYATYLEIENPTQVAAEIQHWWNRYQKNDLPDTRQMPRLTWKESTKLLLDLLDKPFMAKGIRNEQLYQA